MYTSFKANHLFLRLSSGIMTYSMCMDNTQKALRNLLYYIECRAMKLENFFLFDTSYISTKINSSSIKNRLKILNTGLGRFPEKHW